MSDTDTALEKLRDYIVEVTNTYEGSRSGTSGSIAQKLNQLGYEATLVSGSLRETICIRYSITDMQLFLRGGKNATDIHNGTVPEIETVIREKRRRNKGDDLTGEGLV
ncbi:hypothetical protein Ga0100231_023740 [Opitutaceae bacterium TAV4]|nr:hypothetical protein Ga0100231_023740 [Opitutaceae bacterium TAV4]RRK00889.1 hypothetical protein Ga0100230_024255 [Opitutaceae bacterium TAV3]